MLFCMTEETRGDYDKIRQALSDEDAKLYEEFAVEPSLLELALDTLTGRNRWVSILSILVGIVFMALGLYSLWRLLNTESITSVICWALGFVFCMGVISMMKIWYWMEMQRISVVREIKRLELQVACLTQRLTEEDP